MTVQVSLGIITYKLTHRSYSGSYSVHSGLTYVHVRPRPTLYLAAALPMRSSCLPHSHRREPPVRDGSAAKPLKKPPYEYRTVPRPQTADT